MKRIPIHHKLQRMMTLGNEQFVAELYRELLLREPDSVGMRHHLSLLEAGMSRIVMFASVLKCEEAAIHLGKDKPHPGAISNTADWALSFGRETAEGLPLYVPVEREDAYVRPPAKSLPGITHWAFEYASRLTPPEQFVARIPYGRVCGAASAILTPDNRLLQDLSFEYTGLPIEEHLIFLLPKLPQVVHESGTVAVLTSNASANYYHWMIEVAARLYLFRYVGVRIDKMVMNPMTMPFQRETLELLGVPMDNVIPLSADTHLEADLLVVPSFGGNTGVPPRWACRYLRDTIKDKLSNTTKRLSLEGFSRIYVSRANAAYRQVLNEDRVIDLLGRYGFISVRLEQMSVAEQVRLFHSARIIVAPHGAGLTNVVFCEPGASVIEMSSPRFVSYLYYNMSVSSSLEYYYLVGEEELPPGNERFHSIHADIFIDIGKLEALLLQVLAERT